MESHLSCVDVQERSLCFNILPEELIYIICTYLGLRCENIIYELNVIYDIYKKFIKDVCDGYTYPLEIFKKYEKNNVELHLHSSTRAIFFRYESDIDRDYEMTHYVNTGINDIKIFHISHNTVDIPLRFIKNMEDAKYIFYIEYLYNCTCIDISIIYYNLNNKYKYINYNYNTNITIIKTESEKWKVLWDSLSDYHKGSILLFNGYKNKYKNSY